MKKPALLISVLVFTIAILTIVRIFISNNMSTNGVVLGRILEETEKYSLENSILQEKYLLLASLTNVSQKAYDLGYREGKTSLVLSNKFPVAIKR